MIRKWKSSFAALLTVTVLGACQNMKANQGDMAVTTLNSSCPIMPDHGVDNDVTVTYMDQSIGFCCEKCVGKWDSWTDEKKAEYVKKATAAMPQK